MNGPAKLVRIAGKDGEGGRAMWAYDEQNIAWHLDRRLAGTVTFTHQPPALKRTLHQWIKIKTKI